jgi:DNA-binding NarL/FixJ family response regulator
MIDNGALGYVLKNATTEELTVAVKVVALGKTYLSDEVASTLRQAYDTMVPLINRREKEVLELRTVGMTNNEIAARLLSAYPMLIHIVQTCWPNLNQRILHR